MLQPARFNPQGIEMETRPKKAYPKSWACPVCGNRDRTKIADNNLNGDWLGLVCLAKTNPHPEPADPQTPEIDPRTCGMQWQPPLFSPLD
jgi:hypothetical protein